MAPVKKFLTPPGFNPLAPNFVHGNLLAQRVPVVQQANPATLSGLPSSSQPPITTHRSSFQVGSPFDPHLDKLRSSGAVSGNGVSSTLSKTAFNSPDDDRATSDGRRPVFSLESGKVKSRDIHRPSDRSEQSELPVPPINDEVLPAFTSGRLEDRQDCIDKSVVEPRNCIGSPSQFPQTNSPAPSTTLYNNQVATLEKLRTDSLASKCCSTSLSDAVDNELLTHQDDATLFTPYDEYSGKSSLESSPDRGFQQDTDITLAELDFLNQSTSTLWSESDEIFTTDKPSILLDTGTLKPWDINQYGDDPLELKNEELASGRRKDLVIRDLSNKLSTVEDEFATLRAQQEQRTQQLAKEAALVHQKTARNIELLKQLNEKTQISHDDAKLHKSKCDKYEKMIRDITLEQDRLVAEKSIEDAKLGLFLENHNRAVSEAESCFQVERAAVRDIVVRQELMVQERDVLVEQLNAEVKGLRESLHNQEDALRLKENDIYVLQDALTDLWRKRHDFEETTREKIALVESELEKAEQEIKVVKADTKKAIKNLDERLRSHLAAVREELKESHSLNDLYEAQAADYEVEKIHTKEAIERLLIKLRKVEERLSNYELLGTANTRSSILEHSKPKKRLSQEAILVSSEPTLLRSELRKAYNKINDYLLLGLAKTLTPTDQRELELNAREELIAKNENLLAKAKQEHHRHVFEESTNLIITREDLIKEGATVHTLTRVIRGLERDLYHVNTGRSDDGAIFLPYLGNVPQNDSEKEEARVAVEGPLKPDEMNGRFDSVPLREAHRRERVQMGVDSAVGEKVEAFRRREMVDFGVDDVFEPLKVYPSRLRWDGKGRFIGMDFTGLR